MALRMGSEDKKKVAIASVLGLVVLFLVGKMLMENFSTPDIAATTPAIVTTQQPATISGARSAPKVATANLDPTLHPEWMAATESMTYTGNGRNIFSLVSAPAEIEQPKASARPMQVVNAGPPPPPPPPNIDLKFLVSRRRRVARKRRSCCAEKMSLSLPRVMLWTGDTG